MFSIEILYKSAIAAIQDIRQYLLDEGISTDMEYYAWDSRGQTTELPNVDLIGIVGWTFEENDGLPVVQIGILVSTTLDQNLFKEIKIMDAIRNHFVGPNGDYKTVPLLDPDTGVELAQMQVSDFEIMAAGRSETRTTRSVGLELIRNSGD